MSKLALHPTTARQLEFFIKRPSHAVLITGATGIGKTCVAEQLAEQLLGLREGDLNDYSYIRRIRPDDGKAIGIEPIRKLEHFLSLKTPGVAHIKRIIIIEQSHMLGVEAQNALLKTLEGPPFDTVIILTAPTTTSLLPTIQSRVQSIAITRPSKEDLAKSMPANNFDALYAVSGGLPGLLHAMINHETPPLSEAVKLARSILGQTHYERLLQVDVLSKNKVLAGNVLHIMQQMAFISLQTAEEPASKRWQEIMATSYIAAEALDASGNVKLVLSNAFLKL